MKGYTTSTNKHNYIFITVETKPEYFVKMYLEKMLKEMFKESSK